ncbi:diguanylate cyclase [Porticoccus sp.]
MYEPPFATPTRQQLQSTIAELDQAIYNHEQWYKSLLRVLISHVPAETADLLPDAHRRCRFGQWYENVPSAFLRQHPAFLSLQHAHRNMHDCARNLLQLVANGSAIPPSSLDLFENTLDKMRLEIHALRHEFMERVQNQDPLTGALTRIGLLSWLREQHSLVQRGVQTCALVLLDLDHFKDINDRYGHPAGDRVLVSSVQCLQALLRPYDKIYRYGGEEFLICMPSTTLEEARCVAERLRDSIAAQRILCDGSDQMLQVTASFGVTMLDQSLAVEDAIDHVDKAMYEAKTAGRNCVVVGA